MQNKKHTRGERVFFVMKLWAQKNTTLQGEDVDADASAFVTEGSTIVVLALGEDAGTSEGDASGCVCVFVEDSGADAGAFDSLLVATGATSVVVGSVGIETSAVTEGVSSTTGSNPFRYPVTTQSNSTSDAFPPKLFTTKWFWSFSETYKETGPFGVATTRIGAIAEMTFPKSLLMSKNRTSAIPSFKVDDPESVMTASGDVVAIVSTF